MRNKKMEQNFRVNFSALEKTLSKMEQKFTFLHYLLQINHKKFGFCCQWFEN